MSSERIIAVEEHFATRRYIEAAAELEVWAGDDLEMAQMRGFFGASWMVEALADLDARLAVMDESGTDLALLSLNPPGVQAYEPVAAATALVESANDEMAAAVRQHPERLAGLGAVAPQDPGHAAGEIARIMGPLGLSGLMICSHTQGRYLDDPAFEPLLAAAEEHEATIYLHPRYPSEQMIGPYRDYGMVAAVWGYQADAGTHAVRLILSGVLDRHPRLRFVLGHLGEGLPLWMQRLDNRYAFAYKAGAAALGMPKLELTPSEYLLRNFAVTTSGMDDPEAFAFVLERVGEDNVLFAVDYPYEDSAAAVAFLRAAELTDSQRAKVSHANAERLFRRIPPGMTTRHSYPMLTAITGGCGSIGLATAQRLLAADPGTAVVLLDLEPGDAAEELLGAEPGRAHFAACDVTSPDAVAAAFEAVDEIGTLSGLVYAAGAIDNSASTELEFARWREVMAVNIDGAMLCNQQAGRRMLAGGGGSIVNIASIAGRFGHPRRLPYSVGKAAIMQLTRTLAVEWGERGVRVNAVAPGYVETPMVREGVELGLFSRESAAEMHAMKRLADPAELADPIVYLLSDGASFVTGETLFVDGGFSALKAS